jgi:molecular chaperone DnaK (HSP70)
LEGQVTATAGLDFGTATTLVSSYPDAVLPLGRATNWLPSLVYVDGSSLRVGEDAEHVRPDLVLRSVKRAITDRYERFTVAGPTGPVEVNADDAIAAVLHEAVTRARRAGLALTGPGQVRLGCPAMWDGAQRRRLLDLARRVGLAMAPAELVDEPVAAGIAWLTYRFLAHGERPTGRLLVFDMGGGTLDVAVLAVVGGPRPQITVQSCLGVAMAGDALDAAIARDLALELARHDVDISHHDEPELAWALLERAAREAKVRLTHVQEHPVVLPPQLRAPHVLRYRRDQLETAFAAQLDGAENLVISALRAARLAQAPATASQLRALSRADLTAGVDHVLLVGGMSRIPYVARRLAAFFPHATVHDDAGVAPEEAVVAGLCDPAGYERIRLHRPAFDFILDTAAGRATLYAAFTPLYEPWQVYSGLSGLGYERWLRPPDVPAHGSGTLRAVAVDGAPLRLRLDGELVDGLPVALGPPGVTFGLTCDGRLDLVDGRGEPLALRSDGWPVPGPDRSGPALRRLT